MHLKNPKYFYEISEFPELQFLMRDVETIQIELYSLIKENALKNHWIETFPTYVDSSLDEAWQVFPFTFYTMNHLLNQSRCPKTNMLIQKIPELISCDFSRLKGKTTINPHIGYSRMILRCHLPLMVPSGKTCGIKVGNEVRYHEEGKLLIFDDSYEHSAWNESDEDRIVLMFDIPNPLWEFDASKISRYKIETLEDPFLLGIATKASWIDALERGILPLGA